MSLVSVLLLALFGVGLSSAKIERLDDRKDNYAASINSLGQEAKRHSTQEEILNSLSQQVKSCDVYNGLFPVNKDTLP